MNGARTGGIAKWSGQIKMSTAALASFLHLGHGTGLFYTREIALEGTGRPIWPCALTCPTVQFVSCFIQNEAADDSAAGQADAATGSDLPPAEVGYTFLRPA